MVYFWEYPTTSSPLSTLTRVLSCRLIFFSKSVTLFLIKHYFIMLISDNKSNAIYGNLIYNLFFIIINLFPILKKYKQFCF